MLTTQYFYICTRSSQFKIFLNYYHHEHNISVKEVGVDWWLSPYFSSERAEIISVMCHLLDYKGWGLSILSQQWFPKASLASNQNFLNQLFLSLSLYSPCNPHPLTSSPSQWQGYSIQLPKNKTEHKTVKTVSLDSFQIACYYYYLFFFFLTEPGYPLQEAGH